MASFNKVVLAGNLTKDPELRDVLIHGDGEEVSVCDFSLAVNRRGKNASQKADYFNLCAWRERGEALADYKGKGDAILVEGYAQHQTWADEETGQNRSRIVVVAQNIQYIDSAGRGINKVYLAGNLTKDPELRFLDDGTVVANFGLAVNRTRTEGVDFFDVAAFDELAEIVANYKAKGDGVIIEGRLKYDQWEAPDGTKRSKVSVVASDIQFTSHEKAENEGTDDAEEDFEDFEETSKKARNSSRRGVRKGRARR
jgi:single-strand DNA-binding protein